MYIESTQNPKVKAWSQLKTKRGRQTSGLFLVEGARLVQELLASTLHVDAVLWDVATDELPADLADAVRARGLGVTELAPPAFAAVCDTVTPQGVAGIARIPHPTPLCAEPGAVVVLDGVQDPGNVGTMMRGADAFGVRALCCGTGTVDPFAPKVVRASMGAAFRLPVVSQPSISFVQRWRAAHPQGKVVATAADAPVACQEADLGGDVLLLVGNEAVGLSDEARAVADLRVRIPMESRAESLNAAMAGSILLYEAYRQRQTVAR